MNRLNEQAMCNCRCCQLWQARMTTPYRKLVMLYLKLKYKIGIKWHTVFWTFLNVTNLNRPYSRLTCRLGIYRKYSDGRCMYCGEKHK